MKSLILIPLPCLPVRWPRLLGSHWPEWHGPARDCRLPADKPAPASLPNDVKAVWKIAIGGGFSSPVVADGKLYYVSRTKGTFVVAAKPQFQLLAHNTIKTDPSVFNASPAISHSQLLIRSDRCLYCIGKKP